MTEINWGKNKFKRTKKAERKMERTESKIGGNEDLEGRGNE